MLKFKRDCLSSPLKLLRLMTPAKKKSTKHNLSKHTEENMEEERNIPDIITSLGPDCLANYKPYLEMYFNEKYCLQSTTDNKQCDTCIRVHHNGLCLIYLADESAILKQNKIIKNINFKINKSLDRLKNRFSGKRKRGAQHIKEKAVICFVECEDDTRYIVKAGVSGKLLEINSKLIKDPNIVKNNKYDGFICIIQLDQDKNKLSD